MNRPRLKLYNLEGCPYCQMVRRRLEALELPYEKIDVPGPHSLRTEVMRVSGQTYVPVLVDGDIVLDDENRIIEYLEATYGSRERAG